MKQHPFSSALPGSLLFIFLFSVSIASAQNRNAHDTLPTGLQAEVEKIWQQQAQLRQEDSLARQELLERLRLSEGDAAILLLTQLDSLKTEDSVNTAALSQKLMALKNEAVGYPVAPFHDTLFFLYANLNALAAKDRAAALNTWIKKMYRDARFTGDSLTLSEHDKSVFFLYNSKNAVVAISEVDALWFTKKGEVLANDLRTKIISEVESEKQINLTKDRIEKSGWVMLIVLGLCVVIFLIYKFFGYVKRLLSNHKERFLNGISIGKFVLFTHEEHEGAAHKITDFARGVTVFVAVYFSLPLLFGLFPITEKWAGTLFGWVFTPAKSALHALINFIPNFFTILVIYYIFKYALQVAKFFAQQIEEGDVVINGFHADWAQPTFDIFRVLTYAFMMILMFPYLPGSSSPAFQGVSVFLGVLVSLGSSNAIANVVAGLVITYMRPFKVGDRVTIGTVTGDVMEKTLLVTRIKTTKNEEVTVPNSTVLSSNTTNFTANTRSGDSGLILYTKVTFSYEVPWKVVHEVLIKAALKTEHVLHEPRPFVRNTSLDTSNVSYQINVYTKQSAKQGAIYSGLHQNILDACAEEGIELIVPNYDKLL